MVPPIRHSSNDCSEPSQTGVHSQSQGQIQSKSSSDGESVRTSSGASASRSASTSRCTKDDGDKCSTATREEILRAEIWWVLKVVSSGYSFNSCEDVRFVWKQMFPDSDIVRGITCADTKCMYLSCYGIAPFIKHRLMQGLSNECFVLMFDESPNRKMQTKQMDLLVRFWQGSRVSSRYLTSCFMGKATANDIVERITGSLEGLNLANCVQLSMDGPNVN